VGLTGGWDGRTLLAGVCLAGEWLRLTHEMRRSGHGWNDDVGWLDVHARSTHAAAIDVMTGELSRVRFGSGVEATQ
jgi:hypothetical protein